MDEEGKHEEDETSRRIREEREHEEAVANEIKNLPLVIPDNSSDFEFLDASDGMAGRMFIGRANEDIASRGPIKVINKGRSQIEWICQKVFVTKMGSSLDISFNTSSAGNRINHP